MTDMIKEEADNNIQVFEILETNSSEKFNKNNKIAALLNKSNNKVKNLETNKTNFKMQTPSDTSHKKVFYSLVVFHCR